MSKTKLYPARYTLRSFAVLIDLIVIMLLVWLVISIAEGNFYNLFEHFQQSTPNDPWAYQHYYYDESKLLWMEILNGLPLKFAISLAYYTIFEQSAMRATPVKWLLGLRVVDAQDKRLDFWKSLKRNSLKIGLLFLPYMLTSYLPSEFFPLILVWFFLSVAYWVKGSQSQSKQMFYDRWLGSYVKVLR